MRPRIRRANDGPRIPEYSQSRVPVRIALERRDKPNAGPQLVRHDHVAQHVPGLTLLLSCDLANRPAAVWLVGRSDDIEDHVALPPSGGTHRIGWTLCNLIEAVALLLVAEGDQTIGDRAVHDRLPTGERVEDHS